MIVIAGNDHDLSAGERSAKLLKKWACSGKRIATWAMAQLEHIAQQDKPFDVLERIDQRGAGPGAAQHIDTGAGA
jgi:hypothetical protein